jgi:hypothetical protein
MRNKRVLAEQRAQALVASLRLATASSISIYHIPPILHRPSILHSRERKEEEVGDDEHTGRFCFSVNRDLRARDQNILPQVRYGLASI